MSARSAAPPALSRSAASTRPPTAARPGRASLFVDPNTGCSGLNIDENDPNTLFAGMWQVEMHTYAMFSGGPGSGVYVTHDGGATWTHIEGHGLPQVAGRQDRRRARAVEFQARLCADSNGRPGLDLALRRRRRELDAGKLAARVDRPRRLLHQAGGEPEESGRSVRREQQLLDVPPTAARPSAPCGWGGDTHDIWIDPTDPNRIMMTHDGGMFMTTDHGQTSQRVTLPIGQMYHVAVDNDVPYHIYGNMQDNSTMRGLSTDAGSRRQRARSGRAAAAAVAWRRAVGAAAVAPAERSEPGNTAWAAANRASRCPISPTRDIIWASCYGNEVTRYDAKTHSRALHQPVAAHARFGAEQGEVSLPLDAAARGRSVRSQRGLLRLPGDFPHHQRRAELVRDQRRSFARAIRSTSSPRAASWATISASFTARWSSRLRPRRSRRAWSGPARTTARSGTRAIRSATPHWTDVTKNITGLPPWAVISKIEPSHFDPARPTSAPIST